MARITVEDCIDKVENRFELVILAAQRAKDIAAGAELTIDRDDEKDSVISLREIAKGTIAVPDLKEEVVKSLQKPSLFDDEVVDEEPAEDETPATPVQTDDKSPLELQGEQEALAELESGEAAEEPPMFAEDNLDVED